MVGNSILVTGATGNVGREVIAALSSFKIRDMVITAGLHDLNKAESLTDGVPPCT